MTPKEYIRFRRTLNKLVNELEDEIDKALGSAMKCKFPKKVRPAKPRDIVKGNIIWYKHGDNGHFWQIVDEVHYPDDSFKAYTAEDGCRYGLDDAFIELTPKVVPFLSDEGERKEP